MKPLLLSLGFLIGHASSTVAGEEANRGVLNQTAPAWGVTQWLNLPQAKTSLHLVDFKGKVIYLYAFQSWCPGCHSQGFPTLKEVIARYGNDTNVAIVAIQTAFEGFHANGFEQAKQIVKRYDLKIPVCHSGSEQEPSLLMRRYRTGGTPWTIIIDRAGVVRFNDFHTSAEAAGRLIEALKKSPKGE